MDGVNSNATKMIAKLQELGIIKHNARKRKAPPNTAREQRRTLHKAASGSAPLRAGAPSLSNLPASWPMGATIGATGVV